MTTPEQEPVESSVVEEHIRKGAVLYTDGSCKYQNPGSIGWGCHGYIFPIKKAAKPVTVDNHVITDHGYMRNDKHKHFHGHYIEVEPTEYLDFNGSSLTISTNNVAEIQAVCYGLERLNRLEEKIYQVSIFTDSRYVKDGLEGRCKHWEHNNWMDNDGNYIKNHEWWIRLYDVYKEMSEYGCKVGIHWVKGHNGVHGNVEADILAGIGTNYSLASVQHTSFKFSPAKKYWKQDIERHPLLNFKRIYFNSVSQYNHPGQYYQGDSGAADNLIGKRIPATGLSVVRLNTPDPAIEATKQAQFNNAREINAIIMMKADRVFSKDIYPYLIDHGKYALLPCRGNLNLRFFDDQPVTVQMDPTGLSIRAIESFNLLEELLDQYLKLSKGELSSRENPNEMHSHDITSIFYDKEEKKVKGAIEHHLVLKPEFGVGYQNKVIDIQEPCDGESINVKVPLVLGSDLIPRNNLKHLESLNPKLNLITWRESKNSLRYATIIESDDGVGIWSNFFADKIFLVKPS
jgi:ribonuclease HI